MITPLKYLLVVGASAGRLNVLAERKQNLQKGLDTAHCIVLHLPSKGIAVGSKTDRNNRRHFMSSFTHDGITQTSFKENENGLQKKGYKSLATTNIEKQQEMTRHINKLKEI